MARRPSKHTRPARPLDPGRGVAASRDGERFVVRTVAGAAAAKPYRCPGCDHLIPPGMPHVVVWPIEPDLGRDGGVAERRHWHTPCWERAR